MSFFTFQVSSSVETSAARRRKASKAGRWILPTLNTGRRETHWSNSVRKKRRELSLYFIASFFGKGVAVAQQMVPIYDLSHNDPPSGYYTAENNYCSWRSQLSRKWKTLLTSWSYRSRPGSFSSQKKMNPTLCQIKIHSLDSPYCLNSNETWFGNPSASALLDKYDP